MADAKKTLEVERQGADGFGARDADQASHKLAEQMYKATAAQGQPGPQAGPLRAPNRARKKPKKDEGVIDAEYVDVEDKK